MLDVHCHIIPAIDDGAKDLDISRQMLSIAYKSGTKAIVATPHVIEGKWLPSWEQILEGCALLNTECNEMGIDIHIYPGGEVAIHREILNVIKTPGKYCINQGRYLLVELPAMDIPNFTEEFFFTLQTRGITPILAHPERHPILGKNPDILVEWIRRGVLLQVNGSSIMGRMGEQAMKMAELLLHRDMVHCIGSDAHGVKHRTPNLSAAARKVAGIIGEEKAYQILATNPQKVIKSEDIYAFEIKPPPTERQQGVLTRLLKIIGI